jgi:hypothetical protein
VFFAGFHFQSSSLGLATSFSSVSSLAGVRAKLTSPSFCQPPPVFPLFFLWSCGRTSMWISAPTKAASLLAFCVPPGSQAWPGFPLARLQRGTKFPLKLFSIFGFAMRILALGFDSREPVSAFRSSVVRSAVTLFRPVAISTGFDFRFLRSAVVTFSFCSVLTLSFPPAR